MFLFQFMKTRKRGLETHLFGIARVNTGHQRFHHAFKRLLTEPAAEKGGERFIAARTFRRHDKIKPHPEKALESQQAAFQKRRNYSCRDNDEPFEYSRNLPPKYTEAFFAVSFVLIS